jgi:hypothetical protein
MKLISYFLVSIAVAQGSASENTIAVGADPDNVKSEPSNSGTSVDNTAAEDNSANSGSDNVTNSETSVDKKGPSGNGVVKKTNNVKVPNNLQKNAYCDLEPKTPLWGNCGTDLECGKFTNIYSNSTGQCIETNSTTGAIYKHIVDPVKEGQFCDLNLILTYFGQCDKGLKCSKFADLEDEQMGQCVTVNSQKLPEYVVPENLGVGNFCDVENADAFFGSCAENLKCSKFSNIVNDETGQCVQKNAKPPTYTLPDDLKINDLCDLNLKDMWHGTCSSGLKCLKFADIDNVLTGLCLKEGSEQPIFYKDGKPGEDAETPE